MSNITNKSPHIDRNRPRQLFRINQAAEFARKIYELPYYCDTLRIRGWFKPSQLQ